MNTRRSLATITVTIPVDPPIRVTGEYNHRPAEFDLDTVEARARIGSDDDPWVSFEGLWLCKNGNRFRRWFDTTDPAVDHIAVAAREACAVARHIAGPIVEDVQ